MLGLELCLAWVDRPLVRSTAWWGSFSPPTGCRLSCRWPLSTGVFSNPSFTHVFHILWCSAYSTFVVGAAHFEQPTSSQDHNV